jgi:hypothetical protein
VKIIQTLKNTITELQSQNQSLSNEIEKYKCEFTVHATGCETFRKNTQAHLKRLDGLDFTEYDVVNKKINSELARLSKVSVNLQKQITDVKASKTYASIISPSKAPTLSSLEFKGTSHTTEHANGSITDNAVCVNDNHNGHTCDPVTNDQDNTAKSSTVNVNNRQSTQERQSNTIVSGGSLNKQAPLNSTEAHLTQPAFTQGIRLPRSPNNAISTESRESDTQAVSAKTGNKSIRSDGYKSDHSGDEAIFEGVTYKRNARYYISGIGHRSTRLGLLYFLQQKGISVSHFVLFKPKYPGSRMNAKINVAPADAEIVESPGFWPRGISCRPWLSEREWDNKISRKETRKERDVETEHWDTEQGSSD